MAAAEAIQVKQLGELLKEHQEPFILETYLSERRIRVENSGSSKHQRKKPRNGILLLPKLFTVVYNKLFRATSSDEPGKIISPNCVNENSCSSTDERIMSCSASTTSTTTVSNSSSDLDTEQDDDRREKEVDADGSRCRWGMMEESKEHSPVSVLQNITTTSHQVSKFHNLLEPAEPTKQIITESSILSASLWSILLKYPATQVLDCVNSSSQSFMTKQVLEHNSQLLFDCVRELTEGKHKTCRSEEIGKFICNKINAWGTQAEDTTHAKVFADLDFGLDICRGIKEEMSEIGLVIGDVILEKMTHEIVLDMVINLTSM